ncbi:MAG TPA: putative Ig domain-containing protein [Bryobacteraceae bacterium]|nr:putative Ig domain-containing protein [Bryobacteraceae bacterium]
MTIRRAAILAAFGALGAFAANPPIAPTVLPSSAGCTPPSSTVACSSVGAAYTTGLKVTSPPAGGLTAVWSFAAGTQPPGLGISSTGMDTGNISGAPTQPGFYTFTVAATYATVPSTVVMAQYSIAIAGPKLTIVAPLSLPNGTAGVVFTTTIFTASGGVPFIDSGGNAFYHWSIVPGPASQADGLVIDQNSGTLSGTPTNAGIFSVTIGVVDAVGAAAIHIYNLNVSGSNSLTITTTSLPGGIVTVAYSQKLTQTGGPAQGVTWSIFSGNLPTGLNISSNTDSTGTIAGTPTAAGVYNFTVQASYQVSNQGSVQVVTGTAALSITISTQLTMANPTAVSGFVNQSLQPWMQFTAANGTPPYTYALKSGTLPPGMAVNTQTGAITGQATSAQGSPFTFTIEVTDAGKQTADAQSTITITTLTVTQTIQPAGAVTVASQLAVTMTVAPAPGVAITGNLALTFADANTNADNPEVRFSDGTRKVSFSVAADGTVTLSPAGVAVITGTVAGTGSLVASFTDSLGNVLLTSPPKNFNVPAGAPVITSFTIACSGTTYTATFVGYSSTLDMTSLTLNFTAASGVTLTTPSLTVQNGVPQAFTSWWSSTQAAQAKAGSTFAAAVPLTFTVTGGASTNPIVSASGAATNSAGNSTTSASTAVSPPCP